MCSTSTSRELVAALTRGGTGWRISKGIRPAGRWDKQSVQYRKTLPRVIDVSDVIDVIDVIDVTVTVTDAHHPFAILGNRAREQMSILHRKGKRKINGIVGYWKWVKWVKLVILGSWAPCWKWFK